MADSLRVLFIHHSVGRGILAHGQVRDRLRRLGGPPGIELFDHDYNRRGFTGPDGRSLHRALPIPDDNTDPPGLKLLFETAVTDASLRAELQSYSLVVVKSCFPNSRVESKKALEELKTTYLRMIGFAADLGIPLGIATTPPVRSGRIEPDAAKRAATVASWLVAQPAFVGVFDLFGLLADLDSSTDTYGMLKREYTNPFLIDSHPTREASRAIGQPFAQFVAETAARASGYAP